MKLAIHTYELTKEPGTWISMVDWFKFDGGKVGTPGAVKYGDSFDESHTRLKLHLENKGYEIIEN